MSSETQSPKKSRRRAPKKPSKRITLNLKGMANVRHRCRCLPGHTVGRPYLPSDYRKWRAEAVREIQGLDLGKPFAGPCQVTVVFTTAKPRTTKRRYPLPDVDNLQKSLFDAMTEAGCVWEDDRQCVKLVAEKAWGEADQIEAAITELEPSYHV
ncbi:MAG: RusA family crossover junction endodeoxyribonuclease [Marichromatium sp.]|nr:RusA family crossover junction endodeoxyribonuclease [Marichromatium sp.]